MSIASEIGKKKQVLTSLFLYCEQAGNFDFDNDLVKHFSQKHKFGNPFDVTKLDNLAVFPQILLDRDYFVIHLGKGRHRFVKGIKSGFHRFEEINENEKIDWKYRKSILNELDTSESNIISLASNQRIIHDFLYEDIVENPKVYFPRRTKLSFKYLIGDTNIQTSNLQMEIDLTMELLGRVTVFEGKNGFPTEFAVYQLFNPYKYYAEATEKRDLATQEITCCYILRKREGGTSVLRLYNYTFTDAERMDSIRLLKKAQYTLLAR